MKYTLLTLFLAAFAQAQAPPGLDTCILRCLEDAGAKVGCNLEDTACICSKPVQLNTVPCVIANCTSADFGMSFRIFLVR